MLKNGEFRSEIPTLITFKTVTLTVEGKEFTTPSFTISEIMKVVSFFTSGAIKVGLATVVELRLIPVGAVQL
jgi:hypothetical protein